MEQLKIVSRQYLKRFQHDLGRPGGVDRYRESTPPTLDSEQLLLAPIVPSELPPVLRCATEGGTEEEADNALKIYRWLGPLSAVQAADARLWVTLTHTIFWDYTQRRWPGLKAKPENPVNYVLEHWFTKGTGKAGLRRNSVSRLWWAAHLTLKPWERDSGLRCFSTEDEARFTRILLSNQQISFDLLERDFGGSARIRTCMLDALDGASATGVSMTSLSRESMKQLNCVGRTRNLDAMPVKSLRELCARIVHSRVTALS